MLPVVINAEAEKIAPRRPPRRRHPQAHASPGAATPAAQKKAAPRAHRHRPRPRRCEHPIVQQAQKLFPAEIQPSSTSATTTNTSSTQQNRNCELDTP